MSGRMSPWTMVVGSLMEGRAEGRKSMRYSMAGLG